MVSRRAERHPVTPDGRYFVVRGRLWRMSEPNLPDGEREALVSALMAASRDVGQGIKGGNVDLVRQARARVDDAKRALGERGSPWWVDGAPDLNRHLARNTPYADWYARVEARDGGR